MVRRIILAKEVLAINSVGTERVEKKKLMKEN